MTASQSVRYISVPPFYVIFFNALHLQNISFKNSSYVFRVSLEGNSQALGMVLKLVKT